MTASISRRTSKSNKPSLFKPMTRFVCAPALGAARYLTETGIEAGSCPVSGVERVELSGRGI